MQLAIWKLEYDAGANLTNFSSGNVKNFSLVNGVGITNDPNGISDIESLATQYINDSANQSLQAFALKAIPGSQQPSTAGYQDVLAPGYLNFYNLSISTTPNPTNITLSATSQTLKDTASVVGGNNPTGTITFTLVGPLGGIVDTETANVSGDGSYTTSTGYTLPTSGTVAGTYQWDASYSGDTNNTSASDTGNPNDASCG